MEWARQQMLGLLRPYAPRHVAFIMDGNRRWARQHHLEPYAGHPRGSSKLIQAAQWCFEAGVQYVTVFAFAIENFRRSHEEVEALMTLAEDRFRLMLRALRGEKTAPNLDDVDTRRLELLLHRYGVRIRIVGALAMLPAQVRQLAEEINALDDETLASRASAAHAFLLNICVAYAACEEMANVVQRVQHGIRKALIRPDDVNAALLSALMWTADPAWDDVLERASSAQIDLLIRTSAEPRLSNFLLWQVAACECCGYEARFEFVDAMWPEFGLWDLFAALVRYAYAEKGKKTISLAPSRCSACGRALRETVSIPNPAIQSITRPHLHNRVHHSRQSALLFWSDGCNRLDRKEFLTRPQLPEEVDRTRNDDRCLEDKDRMQ
jgi:ditrans,polycis-polyprenyl diphosphate synthase